MSDSNQKKTQKNGISQKSDNDTESILLKIKPNYGNRNHYYHFFFGIFIPLLDFFRTENHIVFGKNLEYLIETCGPFDTFFKLLPCKVTPISHSVFLKAEEALCLNEILLKGYDGTKYYDKNTFEGARSFFCKIHESSLRSSELNYSKYWSDTHKKILVVSRGRPLEFYSQIGRTSGNLRRSIPNINQLENSLENVVLIELEGMSLINQVNLFSNADIIIAQHGAALSNIVWCKRKAIIIEIIPNKKRKKGHFRRLSKIICLKYFEVIQDGDHSIIDTEEIKKIVYNNKLGVRARLWRMIWRIRDFRY